jgi:hypothetical protein
MQLSELQDQNLRVENAYDYMMQNHSEKQEMQK